MADLGVVQCVPITLPADAQPMLAVLIDTEEEFDWSKSFSRSNTSTSHMRYIDRVQSIFDVHGITPTYLIDYPIASQRASFTPLVEYVRSGRAVVGAHLHPWVTPPNAEEVNARNSYPGNLPEALEREKLRILRDCITNSIGEVPRVYRAGRYGLGPNTFAILRELGFDVDSSPSPGFDLSNDGGPDFSSHTHRPYWVGSSGGLLCVPVSGALAGPLPETVKPWLYRSVRSSQLLSPVASALSRLKFLSRLELTPEGHSLEDMRHLTGFLLSRGICLLVLSFHSPTVMPGCIPYARTTEERDEFLQRLNDYLEYFLHDLKGRAVDLCEFRNSLLHQPVHERQQS